MSTLKVDSILNTAGADNRGKVINIAISEITASSTRASATSFADDIVFANYTPVRTTSTVYIIGNASMSSYGGYYLYVKWVVNSSDYLSTGSTPICTYLDYSGTGGNNEHKGYPIHTKIDNTTGASIACKVQGRVSGSTLYINRAVNSGQAGAPASVMYIEVA